MRDQDALHHAEASLSALIESTEDLIWSVDLDYKLLTFNRAVFQAIERGSGKRMAVGMRIEELLPPEKAALYPPWFERALSEGPFRAEYGMGDGRTLELSFNPIIHRSKKTGVSVFGKDISKRKAAEQALREAEAKYRGIFEGALAGIFRGSPEGRSLDANPALARMLGYDSPEELVSTITDSAHQMWLHAGERLKFQEVLEGGAVVQGWERQWKRKDGSAIWVLLNAWRMCGADGRTRCYQGAIQDITARKQAEAALQDSAERRRTILQTAMDGFWLMDGEGRLLEVNETYCRMSGYSEEELLAIRAPALETKETPSQMAAHIQHIMARGEDRFETLHRRKDGSVFDVEVSVQYRPAEGGQFVCFLRDITAAKRAKEEREKLQLELLQAQKMESIGRLAGGVAHDFNNLLTVINGYSRLLLAKLTAGHPLRPQIAEIHRAGERAAVLTRQILAFSRQQLQEPRVLDLNRVVEEVRPMLESLVGDDVEVSVELGAEGGTVRADPLQLERAILNLVANARDAMPGGGRLLLETACVEREESHAPARPEARAGRYVMLAVTDSGTGMDEETRRRMFEPYFTTKEVGKGTGLGLSAVQAAVEQSAGFIEVESEPGRGTALRIYLPRVEGAAADVAPPEAVPTVEGKETVLVVEDLAGVREFVVAALLTYGYQAIPAADGIEALRLCEREGGRIDLVLTDVAMPNLGGRELAGRLRERWPGIKVLFMSAYDDAVASDGDTENFIEKPFSPDQLAERVREMLTAPGRRARILIADDDAEVRGFLRAALESGGYEVVEAANGKQALAAVRAGGVDLAIMDLVMPEQEGIETIVALRKEAPSVGIIAISGALEGPYLGMARALGAQAALSKPVSAELLLAKVAEALEGRE